MSRYVLMPTESGKESIEINLPDELLVNYLFNDLQSRVNDKHRLKEVIKQISRVDLSEHQDGTIALNNTKILDLNFRDAIVDLCNNVLLEKYEKFYDLISCCGIVF